MTKQTDRLLKLEINQQDIKADVQDIKKMMSEFIKESQNGRVACGVKIASTETQTRLQWAILVMVIGSLIAMFIKH